MSKVTITEGDNRCPICDSQMTINWHLRGKFQCGVCKSTLTLGHGPEGENSFELGDSQLRILIYFPWASVIPMTLAAIVCGLGHAAVYNNIRFLLLYPLAVLTFMLGTYHYDRWKLLRRLHRKEK